MPASETETRVAEDVERLRALNPYNVMDAAEGLSLDRVLDALETAQAEAREKDETITQLRKALKFYDSGLPG